MAASAQCGLGKRMTPDRWRAQRHCLDLRMRSKRLFQRVIGRHAIDRAVPADGGDQLHILARGDGGHMLVAGDLADTDKGNAQCVWMLHRNLRADVEVTAPLRSHEESDCAGPTRQWRNAAPQPCTRARSVRSGCGSPRDIAPACFAIPATRGGRARAAIAARLHHCEGAAWPAGRGLQLTMAHLRIRQRMRSCEPSRHAN